MARRPRVKTSAAGSSATPGPAAELVYMKVSRSPASDRREPKRRHHCNDAHALNPRRPVYARPQRRHCRIQIRTLITITAVTTIARMTTVPLILPVSTGARSAGSAAPPRSGASFRLRGGAGPPGGSPDRPRRAAARAAPVDCERYRETDFRRFRADASRGDGAAEHGRPLSAVTPPMQIRWQRSPAGSTFLTACGHRQAGGE